MFGTDLRSYFYNMPPKDTIATFDSRDRAVHLQTSNVMEGELQRLRELNDGLTSDLARFHEREALEEQVCTHFCSSENPAAAAA